MYALEFCIREVEGSWANLICVSNDKKKLEERAILEQIKYLNEYGNDCLREFDVGVLESIIVDKIEEIKKTYSEAEDAYFHNGIKINNYQGIRDYVTTYGIPFAENLGFSEKEVKNIIKDGFYESKRYIIREIEEI